MIFVICQTAQLTLISCHSVTEVNSLWPTQMRQSGYLTRPNGRSAAARKTPISANV